MQDQDYEKLGVFYLGKEYDLANQKPKPDYLLYDAKDLTTHAVVVGMTGSGKTGLCLALLEEAAIDGIPAICIDPKGDIGNLMLTFPQLRPEDFKPWLEAADATRKGLSLDELATKTAKTWKDGLASWDQPAERISRFREAADVTIYTPGSSAGIPLTVLKSFSVPPESTMKNSEALRERINGAVSGLLSLMGVEGDPLRSREHILLSTLLDRAWKDGRDLDMARLIREIQQPPFDKVGYLDLESFYSAKERFSFAMGLNNLLASPGFSAWMEGEPLDIQRLFYTPEGKPRIAVISIAHLNDQERMFFVTMLLNELISWMRAQSGTSSLRALFYMDEIFGYFPPTANPPSKTPLLTLMKQARAFGLGCVLATQNPVDIDYKGLSNAGTWLLGRLQTERDKARVLDGLEGATAAAGHAFDRQSMEKTLSGLGNRVFLMNNVHDDQPVVFQTRWALSFLRGPLTRDQISELMHTQKIEAAASGTATSVTVAADAAGQRPVLPPEVSEQFLVRRGSLDRGSKLLYRPAILGQARVRFANTKAAVDEYRDVVFLLPVGDSADLSWDDAELLADGLPELEAAPEATASFANLPTGLARPKKYAELSSSFKDMCYRTQRMTVYWAAAVKQHSRVGESEGDFRVRLSQATKEQRDLLVEKLKQKYTPKLATLSEQLRKAAAKVEKEREDSRNATIQSAIAVGSTILGAMFGRKMGSTANVGRVATSAKAAQKVWSNQSDVGRAEDTVEAIHQRMEDLNAEFEAEADKVRAAFDAEAINLEEVIITPKKTEVTVSRVGLIWTPWKLKSDGIAEPLN